MDDPQETTTTASKNSIESLSKDELLQKYKSLLAIAKKAKQAKDEFADENKKLRDTLQICETQKEADKKALLTMKEMLEEFTTNKLELTSKVAELQQNLNIKENIINELNIENESVKRQLDRMMDENESLLKDIDQMESNLKQVNVIGMEQKTHLNLLELEVNKLKESESLNNTLKNQVCQLLAENEAYKNGENAMATSLQEMSEKYANLKDINSKQRKKFNALKDRFVIVFKKVNKLKECKRILLETQHEYAEAVTKWQTEIITASQLLCRQMNILRQENEELTKDKSITNCSDRQVKKSNKQINMLTEEGIEFLHKIVEQNIVPQMKSLNVTEMLKKLDEMQRLSVEVEKEQQKNFAQLNATRKNTNLLTQNVQTQFEDDNLEQIMSRLVEAQRLNEDVQKKSLSMRLQLDNLHTENNALRNDLCIYKNRAELERKKVNYLVAKFAEVEILSEEALTQYTEKCLQLVDLQSDQALGKESQTDNKELEKQKLEIKQLSQELKDLKIKLKDNEELNKTLEVDFEELKLLLCKKEEHIGDMLKQLEEYEQNKSNIIEELNANKLISQELGIDKERLESKLKELTSEIENQQITRENENSALVEQLKLQHSQDLNEELQSYRQSYEELQARFEQKEREHADLLGEMRELNEALKARGDVISRQQEKQQDILSELKNTSAQLKDLENKLNENEKSLLTKDEQLREKKLEIEQIQVKVEELQAICSQKEKQMKSFTEDVQSLKNIDTTDSQSDMLSTSTISRTDEISRLRELDESFEDKYNRLRGLAIKLKKKLQEQTTQLTELEKQQTNHEKLKLELKEQQILINDLQLEKEKTQKLLDTLKGDNQKLKSSRKQANVLNLEIEAAEKSLNEATVKLASKNTELESLNEVLTTKETMIVQLRKEIALLESAKNAECNHSKELKEQIDLLQTQIKDAVHTKQSILASSKELEQANENLKMELEELRLQMSNIASKQETIILAAKTDKDQLQSLLFDTENNLKTTQLSLKNTERELEQLRVEYLEYKLKAQAVLRKNQKRDTSKEREQEEELLSLRAVEKQLQQSVKMHLKRIEDANKRMQILNEDNECLQKRIKEFHNIIEELREQNESLANENRNQLHLQKESLKNHRQQIENLNSCHNVQLKDLEVTYEQKIELLKSEHAKVIRIPPIIGAASKLNTSTMDTMQNNVVEQSKIDILLMEREDAEGSEEAVALANIAANRKISNDSSRTRSQHDFMPLDELLNAPMNTINDTVTTLTLTDVEHGSDDVESTHVELQATKERLQMQDTRIRHLTALLAENEQDLAKLSQMNDMLKEELRRQERSVEREAHMHNSEYLKNVIIKFLTLNNGDERTRLVPVLNTILKLSRTETEVLNCVAKGHKVNADGNQRGWGSFLSWGAGNNNT
ncbi:GRIP and coiled-coil domain-containing protein 2 [Teleopsis dalmanni]|uniref:GRIP and coiled-coil domain-containing protein 2 n=1 Tax=Teleopsis dalmanni TaxID=139649 RepID=UPI0018CD0D1F|nr:GRIP and coiled-coil domain-containing protein 2 [Teleopsis dalmanni]